MMKSNFPKDLKQKIERAAMKIFEDKVKRIIEEEIKGVIDPATGAPPRVKVKAKSLDNYGIEIEGSLTVRKECAKILGLPDPEE